jgi:hypothetical protein
MASCGYRTHEGERFWMPECIGGAVYGKHGCTCDVKRAKADQLERIERLEKAVKELQRRLSTGPGDSNG